MFFFGEFGKTEDVPFQCFFEGGEDFGEAGSHAEQCEFSVFHAPDQEVLFKPYVTFYWFVQGVLSDGTEPFKHEGRDGVCYCFGYCCFNYVVAGLVFLPELHDCVPEVGVNVDRYVFWVFGCVPLFSCRHAYGKMCIMG